MAKSNKTVTKSKSKPNNMLFQDAEVTKENTEVAKENNEISKTISNSNIIPDEYVDENTLSVNTDLENQLSELISENSRLKDTIANYISEIEELRKTQNISSTEENNLNQKTDLSNLTNDVQLEHTILNAKVREISELKEYIKTLQQRCMLLEQSLQRMNYKITNNYSNWN